MPGRQFTSTNYRFGFNKGSEKDDEIAGIGNHFTTKDREGDPRLALWWGVDPRAAEQPWQSPYSYMDGNPILHNDPNGDGVGDFALGVAAGLWSDVKGVAQAVRHPIEAGKAIGQAVAHPVNTFNAIKGEVKADWNSGDEGKGKAVWAVASLFIPGGGEVAAGEKTIVAAEKLTVAAEKAAVIVEKADAVAEKVVVTTEKSTKQAVLEANKVAGKKGEEIVRNQLEATKGANEQILSQPSFKLDNGKIAKPDFALIDKDGNVIKTVDAKTGNATSTANQKYLQEHGGTLTGKKYPDLKGAKAKARTHEVRTVKVD